MNSLDDIFLRPRPAWGPISFDQVRNRQSGYYPVTGYHIYCQLRPISDFEETEDDSKARKFVRCIDRYARMGTEAASSYGLVLIELQGTVLHFFKPGESKQQNTDAVIDFVHEFTQVAYEELRPEMGGDWHGFASAFDHGRCLLLNHTSQSTMSTVSLGPCANRPAKRLFGYTPAGHVSAPSVLVKHLVTLKGDWVDLEVKSRKTSPTQSREQFLVNVSRTRNLVSKGESNITNFSVTRGQNIQVPDTANPLRITGSVSRFDLDGFSDLIESAFRQGEEAVAEIANAFKEVMNYAEIIAAAHQPCLMLPWAGDCATFILPDFDGAPTGTPRWLKFCMDWQAGKVNGHKSPVANDSRLRGTKWAAGAAHGNSGKIIAASTHIQQEPFLFATGWPASTSKTAQESAKGNQIAIDTDDHHKLSELHKKIFTAKNAENFWITDQPTEEKIQRLAIETGRAKATPHITAITTTSLPARPANRPYLAFDVP